MTALATPFHNGQVDLEDFSQLVSTQAGIEALLCCGTTGEGALLTSSERRQLLETAKKSAKNSQIWLGISSGVTSEAVREACLACDVGVDGVLITPPAFHKCTQEGFVQHISAVAEAAKCKVMLYNAPSRCGYTLWPEAVLKLADRGITLLKDAGTDEHYCNELSKNVTVLCGNEEKLSLFLKNGAQGVVSVVSNIAPRLVIDVVNGAKSDCDCSLFNILAKLAFCQINPVPTKYILAKLGVFKSCEVRLPLTSADAATQQLIDQKWDCIKDSCL